MNLSDSRGMIAVRSYATFALIDLFQPTSGIQPHLPVTKNLGGLIQTSTMK
jgi:hypothetical protein